MGFVHNYRSANGHLVRWEQLPVQNTQGFRLAGMSWSGVLVFDGQGSILYCDEFEETCAPPRFNVDDNLLQETSLECDLSTTPFTQPANVPKSYDSCIQAVLIADSVTDAAAIIDRDGQIWMWQHFKTGFLPWLGPALILLLSVIAGLIVGALISGIINISKHFS